LANGARGTSRGGTPWKVAALRVCYRPLRPLVCHRISRERKRIRKEKK